MLGLLTVGVPRFIDMETPRHLEQLMTRRRLLQGLLIAPAAAAVASACGNSASTTTSAIATTTPTAAATAVPTTAPAATATAAPAATATSEPAATAVAAAVDWASGGTDLITVAFPETSIFETANTCTVDLTQGTTEGPCYFHSDTGRDISLGKTGVPMMLCAQLVDQECNPLEGYVIEAWHCDTRGVYSGDTSASSDSSSFAGDFCTAGDAEAEASTYFRGQLTTDADGRVDFLSCFPGWYSGRTLHIHFAVSDPDGTTRVISQWCFADELVEEICTTHELYADRGSQDQPLAGGSDTVFPSDGYESFLLQTARQSDGSMLAYGVIQIDPTAVATESGGGPGDDGGDRPGPPPGG